MSQVEQAEPRVRPMTQEDVDAVYDIDVRSYALPWSARAYRYELSQNTNARLWVAELRRRAQQAARGGDGGHLDHPG